MEQIKLSQVKKSYKNKVLYQNVNLSIHKGDSIALVGSNGSGKSVLFKLITGLEKPDSGEVWVDNQAIGRDVDFPEGVGILVNQPGYVEYYSGFKNLKLLAEIKNQIDDDQIKEAMNRVGLDPANKTMVREYSTGMKQKLGICQAIMEDQDIILLDEPFNALDFQTNKDILRLLTDLKAEGKTILLTSHQHSLLEQVCDKFYIIMNQEVTELSDQLKKDYFTLLA